MYVAHSFMPHIVHQPFIILSAKIIILPAFTIFGEKICGSKRTRIKMDMVSVYNFDPFVKLKQVLIIDDKLYNVLVDVTSRQSICSTFGMFCIEKNLNPYNFHIRHSIHIIV